MPLILITPVGDFSYVIFYFSTASEEMYQGQAHTLAVTDSPSYLSFTDGSGYANEFEDVSLISSELSSTNTSFNYDGSHYYPHGPASYFSEDGGGNSRNFDLVDDFLQHFSTGSNGGGGGGSQSGSSKSYVARNNPHNPCVETSAISSSVPHYKGSSFLNVENHKLFAVHGNRAFPHHGHHDMQRSQSPDLHNSSCSHLSSYHSPSMELANYQQPFRGQYHHGQQQPNIQHLQQDSLGEKKLPTMYVQGHSSSSSTGRDHQFRFSGTGENSSPHVTKSSASNSITISSGPDSAPYRGVCKPSEETEILEDLTLLDQSTDK